jgi:1-carboxybiuret hydrolase
VRVEPLPLGVHIIAAPWRYDFALGVAYALERDGVVAAPQPRGL